MTPPPDRTASPDPALSATVVRELPLRYADGADPSLDRPAHVRAGSGIARVPGGIALVQDDANFVALVDETTGCARAIALPAGPGGLRQFDVTRGNKQDKLDLEACVAVADGDDVLLVAFGSGSTRRREHVVLVHGWTPAAPAVRMVHVPRLYEGLRADGLLARGADDALNIEGATLVGDRLRLFARGNGAAHGDTTPSAATCDLDWATLLRHLRDPEGTPSPEPTDVVRYTLGMLDDVRLGFTDAAAWGDVVLFTAAAEDSADAVDDGDVAGSVLGVVDADGRTRWTLLVDERGEPFAGKVEGVLPPHAHEAGGLLLHVVVDADDPGAPSTLCTVRIDGPWRP